MSINKKIILVGAGNVGKTTWIKRCLSGNYENKYIATLGVEVHQIGAEMYGDSTNTDNLIFNVWDCAGQRKFQGLSEGYWIGADAAIIMFDRTNKKSYKKSLKLYKKIRAHCGAIPIIFLGSKVDIPDLEVKQKEITIHHTTNCKYFDISAKSCYQFERPFIELNSVLKSC